jgi:Ser/Thr protein kinase RdoA (MazF antagonist)
MSSAAKAHGLDGTMVAPDWPVLTFDEVRAVLGEFRDVREPVKILSVSPRPFSAASVVATRGERVFVKRHHRSVRDSAGLREEHKFMAHLREHGAVVPLAHETSSGATAIELGEWTYEVHEAPDGVDALSWTPFFSREHAQSAGQALARLHLASEGYEAPVRRLRPLVAGFTIFAAYNAGAEFDRYVAARPSLADYLYRRTCRDEALELLAPLHTELAPLLSALPSLWTHNDLHGSNLLWNNAGEDARAVAVIDFGLCDRSNAVHDLAHAIERSIVGWLALVEDPAHPEAVPVYLDHLCALLSGYESVRPLTESEAAALAPMTALCHAEFALSETDYFLSVLHSEEKARMACEGYLIEHARWFRGAGAGMLNALREWAVTRRLNQDVVRQ